MKKVLITGATGFVGSYVVEELLKHDLEIIASSSNEMKAKTKSWFNKVKYIAFDLSQFDSTTNYFDFFHKPDLLIHLAWSGLPNYKSDFHIKQNLPQHYQFLKNLIENGLQDVTVTGTCFEYGMQEGCLREDMEAVPANPYGRAKNELRKSLMDLQKKYSFFLKWPRLFYMYGKGQNPNSLFSQLDEAIKNGDATFNMSGGEQIRDYLPVEKVAAYIVKIALQQNVCGTINCCSGQPVKIKELVANYLKKKNAAIQLNLGYYPYPDYEPFQFWGDARRLNSLLSEE